MSSKKFNQYDNFLDKKMWSDDEWTIYFSNLELLRYKFGLNKDAFSKTIGVQHAFRRDRKKVDRETIVKICKAFDIDENWLATPHFDLEKLEENPEFSLQTKNKNNQLDTNWEENFWKQVEYNNRLLDRIEKLEAQIEILQNKFINAPEKKSR